MKGLLAGISAGGAPRGRFIAAVLLVLCAVPFVDLGRRTLWPPDEGRYGVVVREMAASGDYVVPTYGGKPRIDKPPLFMWLGAAASRALGGVSEASVRLPSAAGAAICLFTTFVIGARLFDRRTALLAVLVLGTCGRFLLYAQWAATDMLLAAFTTLALCMAVLGRAVPAATGAEARRPGPVTAGILFMAAAALAVLTKGPVGLVLPVGVVLADRVAACRREPRALPGSLGALAAPWAAGLVAFAALAVPWFLLLRSRLGEAAIREVLFHQNVDRFMEAWNAQQPWHFYFKVFPMDFMPWSFLLPLAFARMPEAERDHGASWRFLRTWFVVVFVFFSAASGKSPEYLMPLLPAAALMTARALVIAGAARLAEGAGGIGEGGRPGAGFRRYVMAAAALLGILFAAGAAILPSAARATLPGGATWLAAAAAILAAGAVGLFVLARAGRTVSGAVGLAAAVLAVRLGFAAPLVEAGNAVNVAPEVGRALASLLPPDTEIGVGRKGGDYIMYYASMPVTPLERPARTLAFARGGAGRALVLKQREHRDLAERLGASVEVVRRWGDQERGFVLLRTVPPDGPGDPLDAGPAVRR